jgi:3-oxoacyl-[acyl-carrier-protein] synthase II
MGVTVESNFILDLAVAAMVVKQKRLFAACDAAGVEKPFSGPIAQAIVTVVGHAKGEGIALIESAE